MTLQVQAVDVAAEEDIILLYHLFFGRNPRDKDISEKAGTNVNELIGKIVYSQEFRHRALAKLAEGNHYLHKNLNDAQRKRIIPWVMGLLQVTTEEEALILNTDTWQDTLLAILSVSSFVARFISIEEGELPLRTELRERIALLPKPELYFAKIAKLVEFATPDTEQFDGISTRADVELLSNVVLGEPLSAKDADALMKSTGGDTISILASLFSRPEFRRQVLPALKGEGVLPHLRHLPPLTSSIRERIAEILPLTPVREALGSVRTWSAVLAALVQDGRLVRRCAAEKSNLALAAMVQSEFVIQKLTQDAVLATCFEPSAVPDRLDIELYGLDGVPIVRGVAVLHEKSDASQVYLASISVPAKTEVLLAYRDTSGPSSPVMGWRVQPVCVTEPAQTFSTLPEFADSADEVAVRPQIGVEHLRIEGRLVELTLTAHPEMNLYETISASLGSLNVKLIRITRENVIFRGWIDQPTPFDVDRQVVAALRLNDQNGPLLIRDPVPVEFLAPSPRAEILSVLGGHIDGLAFHTAFPKDELTVELLLEPTTDAIPNVPLQIATTKAKADSSACSTLYGEVAKNSGFSFALPPEILGNGSWVIKIDTVCGDERLTIWRGHIKSTVAFLEAQIATAPNASRLFRFLRNLADAGREDIIEIFYLTDLSGFQQSMKVEDHLEVLARLSFARGAQFQSKQLKDLYTDLWLPAMREKKRFFSFMRRIASITDSVGAAYEQRVFALSPPKEVLLDVVLACHPAFSEQLDSMVTMTEHVFAARRSAAGEFLLRRMSSINSRSDKVQVLDARRRFAWGEYDQSYRQIRPLHHHADANVVRRARPLLSAIHQANADPLKAVAVLTGGRGIGNGSNKPTSIELARTALPLGWRGFASASAMHHNHEALQQLLHRCEHARGRGPDLAETTYSIFYLPQEKQRISTGSQFREHGPACMVVMLLESEAVSEAPAVGEWAVIIRSERALSKQALEAAFSQRAPFTHLLRFVACKMPKDVSEDIEFQLRGIMLPGRFLSNLGSTNLEEADKRLAQHLKSQTIILQM